MKKNKGFTLIEVIVSIAILSIVGLSVMQMFSTSSKVNRKAREIDYANLKATSIVEKIKNNPDNYAKTMKLKKEELKDKNGYVVINEKDAKTSESEYEKIIYYDYQWNLLEKEEDVKKAKFKSTVKLNKKVNYGEYSDFTPKKYSTTNGRDAVIDGTSDQYLIIALNLPEYYKKPEDKFTTYEMYIFKNHTKESFFNWLYDEKNGYKAEFMRNDMKANPNITYNEAVERFENLRSTGEELVIFYAVRASQRNAASTFENPDAKDKAVDSIPFYVQFNDLDKKQNIEIINISNKNIDFYMPSDCEKKIEENVNFIPKQGVFSKTYLDESRKDESNFDAEVTVTTIGSDQNLAKLQVNKYRAN